ncbi:MAG: type III pantothenate kinase [Candidatus Gastranaerophilales bacterium]|nr:type III pantothenate kinase [Candidatus Gastranaerophilales bacterium]
MGIILAIDIGNTHASIGIYDGNKLVDTFRISSDIKRTVDEYGILICGFLNHKNLKIEGAIISSVVPKLGETYKEALNKYLKIKAVNLSYKSKMPVNLKLDNNKEIGADRIANATAVVKKYSLPAIVIDFGTATTFDIVDENSDFIGGIIAPGLEIQARALSQFTSKLPKIKIEPAKSAIAKDTISAMLSGIVLGHKCMIEGMIKNCEKELNAKATIVATGGYSDILFENSVIDYIDKDLTLLGLKELYYLNKD